MSNKDFYSGGGPQYPQQAYPAQQGYYPPQQGYGPGPGGQPYGQQPYPQQPYPQQQPVYVQQQPASGGGSNSALAWYDARFSLSLANLF